MATILVKYDDLTFTETVEGWEDSFPKRINMMAVPKRWGGLVQEVAVGDARRISLKGKIQEQDATTCRTTIDNFAKTLNRFNKKLRLWDDRYIYAYPLGFHWGYVPGTAAKSAVYSIDFICADPFFYLDATGSDVRTLNSSDTPVGLGNRAEIFTINNTGNIFVYPKIVVAATDTITTVIVRNLTTGRNFTYSGTILAGTSLTVDCGLFTVTNNGTEDLTNWSGSFLWLEAGNNSIEIEGKIVATYTFTWLPRVS